MKSKIVAVTVSKFYLNGSRYVVKNLSIGHRKDGSPFWKVHSTAGLSSTTITPERDAMEISRHFHIPYLFDIKNGQRVTESQMMVLKAYDVIV